MPTHPGETLLRKILIPAGLTQVGLAKHLGVPIQRINELVRGKRGITSETAWSLAQASGTSREFWVNLKTAHERARSRPHRTIRPLRRAG